MLLSRMTLLKLLSHIVVVKVFVVVVVVVDVVVDVVKSCCVPGTLMKQTVSE